MRLSISVSSQDDLTDGEPGSIEQKNVLPEDLGFVEFLSVPGIIETSKDKFGMLLPIETRDRIVAEIIAKILDKKVVTGDQLKSLAVKIRDHFDKSKIWLSYFDVLCRYKDFISDRSRNGNRPRQIRQETRENFGLDEVDAEEYGKIMVRLSLTTKVFARFVTDATYYFMKGLPAKAPESFQKNT